MPEETLEQALFHLAEECAELTKAASKINRFGPYHSKKPGGPTNIDRLISEFSDVCREYNKVLRIINESNVRRSYGVGSERSERGPSVIQEEA